ncbi:DUF58 domain-containing protein [Homoserinibacter sp. YIM 151385]|uniref:DUF58 domain-containing protein n=1 Tax=Homoserinibacter sp. YIM 151385 TaxID=2985506 RepID=UPI0022F0F309|nr:DUF58 domain-containing protein [Homoserinibacter sp. YIM 151385]WBU38310.1 DUF58 domain-containing protein [Homoserinibacter sp. YIM 151385]
MSTPREPGRSSRRGATRTSATGTHRPDAVTTTGDVGLTNTRTRLVGTRTGFLAEAVVASVRAGSVVGGVLRRAGSRLAGVVTPLGWVVLALVPLCLLAGYRLGWIELAAVGWAGVLLIVVAAIALVGRPGYRMTLELAHRRVVVGDTAAMIVRIENPGRLRILGSTAEIPVGEGLVEVVVPGLRGGGVHERETAVPTVHRGIVPVGPVRSVRADPIGLVRRELIWADAIELTVHPRTVAVPSTSTGLIRDLEGAATRDLTDSDVSFHALREYQAGDDRRYIHWKSTAKTGTYMVRQFEQTRRSHLVVALSLALADYASPEEFELAVSAAGSLGVRAIRDGRTVSVVVSEKTPEFARRKVLAVRGLATVRPARLLDDLAVVQMAPTALGVRDVARVTADRVAGISVAFLICGSVPAASELRAASSGFPPDVEVVAVVCDPEAKPGLRRVAGLTVLTIGYLDDLRAAMARAAAIA